jgi:hypothetical protein
MPLPAQILMIAGMASMFLSMGAACLAAPKLKAWLKRQTPTVEVPDFDFGDQRGTDRLISMLWSVRIPSDRPRLRRLVLVHRAGLIAMPCLMLAGGITGTLLTGADGSVEDINRGVPPRVVVIVAGDSEPAP